MDQRVLVHQHPQPHAAEFRDPGRGARIVFMVARHQIHAMRRAQLAQRAGLRGQLFDAAVDHVAGDGDEVRRFLVDRVHDGLHVALLDGGADVDVADLHDGEAVQVGRQAGDGHVHRDHARERALEATMVAASASVATHQAEACRSAVQPNSRPARLASHRISSSASRSTVKTNSDENRPIVISPTQAIRSPQGGRAGPGQHAQRDQDAGQRQRQHGRGRAGAVMQSVGNEAGADVEMGQRAQRESAGKTRIGVGTRGGTGAPARQARSKELPFYAPEMSGAVTLALAWLRQARGACGRARRHGGVSALATRRGAAGRDAARRAG